MRRQTGGGGEGGRARGGSYRELRDGVQQWDDIRESSDRCWNLEYVARHQQTNITATPNHSEELTVISCSHNTNDLGLSERRAIPNHAINTDEKIAHCLRRLQAVFIPFPIKLVVESG